MEHNIQSYVFITVQSPETKYHCVFVTLEGFFNIYRESRPSSMESAMLHGHVSTGAQDGQTKHGSRRGCSVKKLDTATFAIPKQTMISYKHQSLGPLLPYFKPFYINGELALHWY